MTVRHSGAVLVLPRKDYARNRRRWLEARAMGLGGTDAAAAMGLSPWRSPLMVYLDKINPDLSDTAQERMIWGLRLEHPIALECGKREGLKVLPSPGLLAHPSRPWQLATLDRIVWDGSRQVPLEIKTTDARNAKQWPATGNPPDHVIVQIQHQLEVRGDPYGYLACLIGGNDYRFWQIERDDRLIADMVNAELKLWRRVETRHPPLPVAGVDDEALMRLYPAEPGSEMVADEPMHELLEEIQHEQEQGERSKVKLTALLTELRALMGPTTELVDENGDTLVTYREHVSRRLDTVAFKRDLPHVYDRYSISRAVRPLRVLRRDDDADAATPGDD